MNIDGLAQALFGSKRAETQEVSTDGTTRTYTGVALTDSEDGTVVIDLGGDVTLPDDLYDEDGNVVAEWDGVGVEMPTSPQVSAGDDVIVTLMGGSATKTPMVTSSAGSGDRMRALVNAAQTVADAAQAVAEAVNQHFFADTNGIHVTEATQDDWDESHTGANVLINSIGQLFRDGLNNLLTLTTENGARALTIWDGLGNAAGNVLATFGATETHIGMSGTGNVYMANDKFLLSAATSEGEYETGKTYTQVESGFKAQNLGENYHVYSGLNSKLTYNDDGGYTSSDTYIDAWVEDAYGSELRRAYVELWADPLYQTAVRLYGDEIGLDGENIWYLSPYDTDNPLQLGKPQRLNVSKSCTAGTSDTMGPAVTLSAGIWLITGNWTFANSSSSAKRLVVGLYRNSAGQAYTYRVHTTASSSSSHRLEVVDTIVLTSEETMTLYGSSSPASTSAATQWIVAIRLA